MDENNAYQIALSLYDRMDEKEISFFKLYRKQLARSIVRAQQDIEMCTNDEIERITDFLQEFCKQRKKKI